MEQDAFGNMTNAQLIPDQGIPCFTVTRVQM